MVADVGCRNTVFGAEAQQGVGHLREWRKAGVRHFRLEFVHESEEEVARVVEGFRVVLEGRKTEAWLERELREIAPEGVTEGSLYVPKTEPVFRIL